MDERKIPFRAFPNPLYLNSLGMDLCDYFAAAALPQLLAARPSECQQDECLLSIATSAYALADKMMLTRNKE